MTDNEAPTVYTVERDHLGTLRLTRRDVLAVSGTVMAVSACGADDDPEQPQLPPTPDPKPSTVKASDNCTAIKAHVKAVTALAFGPKGTWLASGSNDKTVKVWRLPGGMWRSTFTQQTGQILALAAATDGSLFSGSADHSVLRRAMPGGKILDTFEGDATRPAAIAVDRDGTWIAYPDQDGAVAVHLVSDASSLATLDDHTDDVYALTVTDDGTRLASAGRDKRVLVTSMPDSEVIATLTGHAEPVRALAWGPEGSWLASGGDDGEVKIWNPGDAEVVASLHNASRTKIKALAAAPDGTWLAVGLTSGNVMIWSMPRGVLRATLKGHEAGIASLAVSPDGLKLASGDNSGTVLLWSMPGGTALGCLLDVESNKSVKGLIVEVEENGKVVKYTLPCGSPIADGGLCTCNCVSLSGAGCSCVGHSVCSCVGHSACSCVGDTCSCVGYTSSKGTHYWYPN